MARSDKAVGSLVYTIDLNSAKAIQSVNLVKREIRQLTNEFNNNANSAELLGKNTYANFQRLTGAEARVVALRKAVKDFQEQIAGGALKNRPTEEVNKLKLQFKGLQNELRSAENSYKVIQNRVVLFNNDLDDLNKKLDGNKRITKERVSFLKETGRETEAVKVQTKGLTKEYEALTEKQKIQSQNLKDYRKSIRRTYNISDYQAGKMLEKDGDYLRAVSYLDETKKKAADVKQSLELLSTGYEQVKLKSDQYARETKALTDLIKTQSGTYSASLFEMKRLSKQREIDSKLMDVQAEKLKKIKSSVGENAEEYKKAKTEYERFANVYSKNLYKEQQLRDPNKISGFISDKTAAHLDKTNKSIKTFNNIASKADSLVQATTRASLGFGAVFAIGAKNAAKLDDSFNKIKVLMTTGGENEHEVNKNLTRLKNESTESSVKYGVEQQKIANGYEEMTKRGYDSNQVLGASKYYLQGAIASGDDYNDVVHYGSAALEGFNLNSKRAKEMSKNTKKVINQLTYAADLTATDFKSMGYAMSYVASTAHSANQKLGDTAGAIGILSNNGVEGSKAGTGLRKVLNAFASPNLGAMSQQGPVMKQLGLTPESFRDAEGRVKNLKELIELLNEKTKNMNEGQRLDIFHKFFGSTGQEAGLILSKNVKQMSKLNDQIGKAQKQGKDGYVANIAERNMNTAEAQLKRLKEAGKALASSYAVTVLPIVSDFAKKLANIAEKITGAPAYIKAPIAMVAAAIPVFTGLTLAVSGIAKVAGGFKSGIKGMKIAFDWLRGDYKKQDKELDNQIKTIEALTAAIKKNTEEKKKNGKVDMTGNTTDNSTDKNNSGGNNSGGSGSTTKEKGSTKNSKTTKTGSTEKNTKTTTNPKKTNTKTITKTAETVEKDAEKVGKTGGKFKNLGRLSSGIGIIAVGLDAASTATDLFTNNKNTGSHAAGAAGAGLGAAVPIPIVNLGTSALGGYVGGKLGGSSDKYIEEQDKRINKKRDKQGKKPIHYAYLDSFNRNVADSDDKGYGIKMSKSAKEKADWESNFKRSHFRGPTKDEEKAFDDKQNLKIKQHEAYDKKGGEAGSFIRDWVKAENEATKSWATNTSKSSKSVKSNYEQMFKVASDYSDKKLKSDKKNYDYLVKQGLMTQAEADKAYKNQQNLSNSRVDNLKKTIQQMKDIDVNGGKGRKEQLEKLNKQFLALTDKGSKDQKAILKQLNSDTTKMDGEKYAKTVLASKKARDSTVNNANKQYQAAIKGADKEYNKKVQTIKETDGLSEKAKNKLIQKAQEQHDNVVSNAQEQKKDTIKWANEQYDGVVTAAQNQAQDTIKAISGTIVSSLIDATSGITLDPSQYKPSNKNKKSVIESTATIGSNFSNAQKNLNKKKKKHNKYDSYKPIGFNGVFDNYNARALGGKPVGEETALMNEDGEESIYNRKKGIFSVVRGKAGLVKLHAGDEVLTAKQTKEILKSKPKRGKSTKAYANGSGGKVTVKLDATGVKTAVAETKKVMLGLNKILSKEYKRATLQSSKLLADFRKFSASNWDKIGDETHKASKSMTDTTNKDYKSMNAIVSKSTKDMKDTVGNDTKTLVDNYNRVMSKLPDYANDSMKKATDNLNKGVSGINTSLKEFGGNVEVLKPIKYATGSNGKLINNQLAMINDAPTDQKQEAVIRDENVYLPKGENRLLNLQAGDQVLNGKQTAKLMSSLGITRYAGGSGVSDDTLKKLAKKNSKNPKAAYKNDFTTKVKVDGSDLQKSLTEAIINGMKPVGESWTKAMWNLIQDTIDGGTASGSKGAFLKYAEKIGLNKKYVMGATGPDAFDCSGLIQEALKKFGLNIGRDTVSQQNSSKVKRLGKDVSKAEPGDLAFFGHGTGDKGHVGIVSSPNRNMMFNATPPKGGFSNISQSAQYVPGGLDGFYSVNGLSSSGKKNSSKNEGLESLVKKQLGSKALKWIEKTLGDPDQGAGYGGDIPEAKGDHKNWLKQAGINQKDYGYASEIAFKESSWNPRARNGQYYGIAQTTVDNYKKYGGPNWETNPVGQLRTMRKYVENRYGTFANAIDFRRKHDWYENGGLSTKHKLAEISEGNKPEMVIPLTNKSRSVELILKSLEFMFGNGSRGNNSKSNKTDDRVIKQLIKLNQEKDRKIDNILDKMDILISTIQNKPVISENDIYRANKKQSQNQQRFSNLGKGAF